MCIVVDANTLGSVFNSDDLYHDDFKPVYDWIFKGKGKIVIGGTKYQKELRKFLSLFNQLAKVNKTVYIDDELVDNAEALVSNIIQHKDFDDQHLVGLLTISGCRLICSLDKRAYPFFRHNLFFSPAYKRPKIYRSRGNKDLLSDRNIADICKPCLPITKSQQSILSVLTHK